MRRLIYILTIFIVVGGCFDAHSQMNRKKIKSNNRKMMSYRGKKFGFDKTKQYNSISISLNALNYYGDLAPKPSRFSTDLGFTKPGVAISYSHRFGPRYTISGSFMYGTLKGGDTESANQDDLSNGVFRYNRNLSFRNKIQELAVIATFDLFANQATYISRVDWTPYAFIGVSGFHHNPQAKVPATHVPHSANDTPTPFPNAGDWVDLRPLGTEGQYSTLLETDANADIKEYSLFQIAIPFGVGARFRLNEVFDLSAEFGFRYLFTDYIDDVSKNYVDLGVFGDNELAKAMSYRSFELNPTNARLSPSRDGSNYYVIPGYGEETKDNVRGNNGKDIFTVFTVRVSYIIGKSFHRAKFR